MSDLTYAKNTLISGGYTCVICKGVNRAGDGICPFESAVMSINSPDDAYKAILSKMQELGISL